MLLNALKKSALLFLLLLVLFAPKQNKTVISEVEFISRQCPISSNSLSKEMFWHFDSLDDENFEELLMDHYKPGFKHSLNNDSTLACYIKFIESKSYGQVVFNYLGDISGSVIYHIDIMGYGTYGESIFLKELELNLKEMAGNKDFIIKVTSGHISEVMLIDHTGQTK